MPGSGLGLCAIAWFSCITVLGFFFSNEYVFLALPFDGRAGSLMHLGIYMEHSRVWDVSLVSSHNAWVGEMDVVTDPRARKELRGGKEVIDIT